LLDGSGEDRGDAIIVAGRAFSSEALLGCGTAVADRIQGADAVVIDAQPCLEFVVGVLGALQAGVPVVPVPPDADEGARRRIHRESGATLALARATDDRRVGDLPIVPISLAERSWTRYPEPPGERDAAVLYTGGTSGAPRGVRISRRAVAAQLDRVAEAWGWTGDDVVVQQMPLFRAGGLLVGLLGALRRGSRIVQLGRHDSGPALAAAAGSLYLATPGMWSRVCAEAGSARQLSRARLLVSADSCLPPSVFAQLRLLTSHRVVEGYGTTETLLTIAGRSDGARRAGVVGPPLPGVETRLSEPEPQSVTADGRLVGELSVRSPTLCTGYVGAPDGLPGTDSDGWYATGDLAVIEPDGSHRIIGRRATDVVLSRTRLIRGAEVEEVLLTHPGVREAVVVGTPHRTLGQQVTAYVVAGRGVTAQELIDHVGRHLAAYQRPRQVHLVGRLPRSVLGRVRKSLLIGH